MAKKDIWMPLNIGDYLADTMSLTAEQHGVYLLLLMDYWKSGPLADDDRQLAATGKVSLKAWRTEIGAVVRRFFTIGEDGHLHQKRADLEIAKAGRISEARRNAAQDRHRSASKRDANAMQMHSKPDANAHANEVQESHKTGDIARVHALAPPLPRTLDKQSSVLTQSPRAVPIASAQVVPSKENGFNGYEDGKEVIGGWIWVDVWPRIVAAAKIDEARWLGNELPVRTWLRDGIEPDTIVAVMDRLMRSRAETPQTLNYFDNPIREAHAKMRKFA